MDIPADILAAADDHVPKGIAMRASIVWYVAKAILAEREACAKAARDCLSLEYQNDYGSLPDTVAEAIRSRGEAHGPD